MYAKRENPGVFGCPPETSGSWNSGYFEFTLTIVASANAYSSA